MRLFRRCPLIRTGQRPPRIAWKIAVGEGWSSFAVQGDVAVTMEQHGEQELVIAYNVLDGSMLWNAVSTRSTSTSWEAWGRAVRQPSTTIVSTPVLQLVECCVWICRRVRNCGRELLELAGAAQTEFEKSRSCGDAALPR